MAKNHKNPWSELHNKGDNYILSIYDSVDEMWLDAAEPAKVRSRSSRDNGADFTGTSSFEEALDLGTTKGWIEGAQKALEMRQKLGKIEAQLGGTKVFKVNTIVGGSVNIPRFVGGDKRHMTRRKRKRTGDGTHVTIGVECGMLGFTDTDAVVQRGCAVSALIRAIENIGISVELTALHTARTAGGIDSATTAIRIKRAGAYMNDERITFALGHPSEHRRGVFGIRELYPEFRNTFPGYGSTADTPEFIREQLRIDYHMYNIHADNMNWGHAADEDVIEWLEARFTEICASKNIKA